MLCVCHRETSILMRPWLTRGCCAMVKENKFLILSLLLWLIGPFPGHSLSFFRPPVTPMYRCFALIDNHTRIFLLIGVRGKLYSLLKKSEKKQPVEKNIWIKENGIKRRSTIELQSEMIRKNSM